jgi:hypothetical protein
VSQVPLLPAIALDRSADRHPLSSSFSADETIIDLDWTTTSELQSVLAVGFAHHVLLLCQQRMSYVEGSGAYWAPILKLDISLCVSSPPLPPLFHRVHPSANVKLTLAFLLVR